jgi:amino acid transporter
MLVSVQNGSRKTASSETAPRLRRVLGLWDLIFYGIILIQPIAPVGIYGIATRLSQGHMVTTLLLAMVAMMFTAMSYGRMAAVYPSAGSAYTYVGQGLNPHLGFLVGWATILDYLIIPVINTIYAALTLQRLFPGTSYTWWAVLVLACITGLNLRGIQSTARSNTVLLLVMLGVVALFFFQAIRFLYGQQGWPGLFSIRPLYNPDTFQWGAIATATSLATLTYIGFDGITTLAEDARNPQRNILLATVLVCLITGLLGGMQIYLAQRVWPDYSTFPREETAFFDVCARVGGTLLFQLIGAILLIASVGSGLAGQVGAARLLFGMGRDNVIPRRWFSYLSPRSNTPVVNLFFVGAVALVGCFLLNYERAAETLNFGAFLAFMGVNLAALHHFYVNPTSEHRRCWWKDLLPPLLGFLFCLAIWASLPRPAKWIGGGWLLAGILYLAVTTQGFRQSPRMVRWEE